ncbi:MAG: helix-turn-helix domain-containing protein [Ruminococcaceae bacterium]|nr:helix-turn-helix domain-containing protein [Oscillospiraceae bacterium]
MSQDELAEKLEVTRQSVSLWETGQTQPSLDNIIALANLFDISTDALLKDSEPDSAVADTAEVAVAHFEKPAKKKKTALIVAICCIVVAVAVAGVLMWKNGIFGSGSGDGDAVNTDALIDTDADDTSNSDKTDVEDAQEATEDGTKESEDKITPDISEKAEDQSEKKDDTNADSKDSDEKQDASQTNIPREPQETPSTTVDKPQPPVSQQGTTQSKPQPVPEPPVSTVVPQPAEPKDIYGYLKDFVIKNGIINGDYCYYSQDADKYGGYASERFSLYYWGDTEKIEFCLHSVLDDMFSINFYIYVPKEHTGKYEYISSHYYRDTGEPLFEAKGVIDAAVFTKNYPLNCTRYIGSTDVQNDFMEISRQGICDLIDCLKNFIVVENLKYSFYDFGFFSF